MILGRPVNVWVGLISGAIATATTIISAVSTPEVAQQWAIILGAIGGFLGIFVAFLAGQTPTLNTGDKLNVVTPQGEPNKTIVV